MSEPVSFSFFDPAYRKDPHRVLHRLRELDPVHQSPMGWIVTRHEDVARLNRDPRCGRDLHRLAPGVVPRKFFHGNEGLTRFTRTAMFHIDGADHARIRKLMAYAFTPSAIAEMRAIVVDVAGRLVRRLPAEGPIELIGDFARPLPVTIICEMLGVPAEDFARVAAWSDALAETVEPTITAEQVQRAEAAFNAFTDYLAEVVELQRRGLAGGGRQARATLVGRLIAAEAETAALSAAELLTNLVLLLVAGHETTTNLIGNGMLALLDHPDQLALLRREPALMDAAVEEMLRYESPANTNARVPQEAIEVGGKTIAAGQLIICMLGAANRDPAVFVDPDRFDIRRDPNPHQSFGGGPHFCIGAHLARLEARVAFDLLLDRYPHIGLDRARTSWRPRINLRGLAELGLVVGEGS
jgi:cytochrome P450